MSRFESNNLSTTSESNDQSVVYRRPPDESSNLPLGEDYWSTSIRPRDGGELSHTSRTGLRTGPRSSQLSLQLASQIPRTEYDRMINQFRDLSMKDLMGELSPSESADLKLLKWKIERVEESRMAPNLEALDLIVDQYAGLASEISGLLAELKPIR